MHTALLSGKVSMVVQAGLELLIPNLSVLSAEILE